MDQTSPPSCEEAGTEARTTRCLPPITPVINHEGI